MHTKHSLLWTFPIQLYLCMNIVQLFVDGSNKLALKFNSATPDLNDKICPGKDVLRKLSSPSTIFCAHICAEEPLCLGFFFQQDDGVCVTTRNYFLDTTELSEYQGMKYFRGPRSPNWNGGSIWSDCSATCGTGFATRTRTCHPCTGISTETKDCNTYACRPRAPTCAEWATRGLNQSGLVEIDPFGNGTVVIVTCDFDKDSGKAFTVLKHNQQSAVVVGSLSYNTPFVYEVGFEIAIAVVDLSTECKQYVAYECFESRITDNVYWRTRQGDRASYFNGSPSRDKRCACGETNSCVSGYPCNCDNDDFTLRSDTGFARNKSELPISGFEIVELDENLQQMTITKTYVKL